MKNNSKKNERKIDASKRNADALSGVDVFANGRAATKSKPREKRAKSGVACKSRQRKNQKSGDVASGFKQKLSSAEKFEQNLERKFSSEHVSDAEVDERLENAKNSLANADDISNASSTLDAKNDDTSPASDTPETKPTSSHSSILEHSPERYMFKQIEIAELCEVSKQYVSRKIAENGIQASCGLFDLRRVLPVLFKNKGDDRLLFAKIRKEESLASLAELELDEKKRNVVAMSEVSDIVKAVFESFAASIQVLPRKLALRVVGLKSVEEVLATITAETDIWQKQMLDRIQKKVDQQ